MEIFDLTAPTSPQTSFEPKSLCPSRSGLTKRLRSYASERRNVLYLCEGSAARRIEKIATILQPDPATDCSDPIQRAVKSTDWDRVSRTSYTARKGALIAPIRIRFDPNNQTLHLPIVACLPPENGATWREVGGSIAEFGFRQARESKLLSVRIAAVSIPPIQTCVKAGPSRWFWWRLREHRRWPRRRTTNMLVQTETDDIVADAQRRRRNRARRDAAADAAARGNKRR